MATIKQFRWQYYIDNSQVTYPDTGWNKSEDNSAVEVPLGLNHKEQQVIKLGVQAPSGTRIRLNEQDEFLIGNFGILEFNCADITITKIEILGNKTATINEELSKEYIDEGLRLMDKALTDRLNTTQSTISITNNMDAVNVLNNDSINVTTGEEINVMAVEGEDVETTITNEYATSVSIETTFLEKYTDGYNKYLKGVRGVYDFSASNIDNVYNVLIDVMIEEKQEGGNS